MEIRQFKHGDEELARRMWSFLVSNEVRRALGVAISSDEATTWWLAADGEDTLGFAAARMHKGLCQLRHAYVVPGARGQGVYRQLCSARLEACRAQGAQSAQATVNDSNLGHYLDLGFAVTGKRGKYTTVAKELRADAVGFEDSYQSLCRLSRKPSTVVTYPAVSTETFRHLKGMG